MLTPDTSICASSRMAGKRMKVADRSIYTLRSAWQTVSCHPRSESQRHPRRALTSPSSVLWQQFSPSTQQKQHLFQHSTEAKGEDWTSLGWREISLAVCLWPGSYFWTNGMSLSSLWKVRVWCTVSAFSLAIYTRNVWSAMEVVPPFCRRWNIPRKSLSDEAILSVNSHTGSNLSDETFTTVYESTKFTTRH